MLVKHLLAVINNQLSLHPELANASVNVLIREKHSGIGGAVDRGEPTVTVENCAFDRIHHSLMLYSKEPLQIIKPKIQINESKSKKIASGSSNTEIL
jgi:hypothetical protein